MRLFGENEPTALLVEFGQDILQAIAVARAKERLYVVGNRELWRQAGLFSELDARLPPQ